MTDYTLDQVNEALEACTGYIVEQLFDDDHDEYILLDKEGYQEGDSFAYLEDVVDYVTDNPTVNEYLKTQFG